MKGKGWGRNFFPRIQILFSGFKCRLDLKRLNGIYRIDAQ
jgi:hypothetical protein